MSTMPSPEIAAAGAGIAMHGSWRQALGEAIEQARTELESKTGPCDDKENQGWVDLALLFASSDYVEDFPSIVTAARTAVNARLLVGCSGVGVIGPSREIEQKPALSLLLLRLPGVSLTLRYVTQTMLEEGGNGKDRDLGEPGGLPWLAGLDADSIRSWILFADPFRLGIEALIARMEQSFPTARIVGGLASGDPREGKTYLFIDDGDQPVPVRDEGALLIGIGGDWTLRTLVAQGCIPIGQPWTITEAEGPVIHRIAGRPALDVLADTLKALPLEIQTRAQRGNPFVGLAMDEHRTELRPGDFLIRNLLGFDRERGVIAIGGEPKVGQTLQFHLRDGTAAEQELNELLSLVGDDVATGQTVAALLCSCAGRGTGMFGMPNHDAEAISSGLGPLPLAGFFCNGEIGPVGNHSYVHGYTASIALVVHDPLKRSG